MIPGELKPRAHGRTQGGFPQYFLEDRNSRNTPMRSELGWLKIAHLHSQAWLILTSVSLTPVIPTEGLDHALG